MLLDLLCTPLPLHFCLFFHEFVGFINEVTGLKPQISFCKVSCFHIFCFYFNIKLKILISPPGPGSYPLPPFMVQIQNQNYIFNSFRILFRTLNHQYDYTFDWTMLKQKAAASAVADRAQPPVAGPPQGPR